MEHEEPQKKTLNARQIRFAQAYARTNNGALSARQAGVAPENSAKTAHRWLHDSKYEHVQEYVDELLADDAEQRKIDHDILRQRLRSRLTVDQRAYFRKNGQPLNPKRLDEELAQHVQTYTHSKFRTYSKDGKIVQEGTNATLKLSSDTKAMELLGRHSGFFNRESTADQFNDYLQADSQLEGLLAECTDELDEDTDEASDEEATGDT